MQVLIMVEIASGHASEKRSLVRGLENVYLYETGPGVDSRALGQHGKSDETCQKECQGNIGQ